MATPLQRRICKELVLYAVMLFFIPFKSFFKIVCYFRNASESNHQQIGQEYNASVNKLLWKDDFERSHKKLSFVFLTKCDFEVHCNKGLTIIIPGLLTVVSNPTIIREQSKVDTDVHSNKSNKTRYSTEEMHKDFHLLFNSEYTNEKKCEDNIPENSHADAACYIKTLSKHEVGQRRRQFCPRTHRPVQVIPVDVPLEERSMFQTSQTDSNGYYQWNHEQIVEILKERSVKLPELKSADCRRNTFISCIDWYYLQFNSYWSMDAFIDAGFYLKDNHGNLECFSCGLQIRHDIDDNPYRFHQNYSPHCLALTRVDKEVVTE